MSNEDEIKELGVSKHGRCPTCGRKQLLERAPFCSTRCAQVDLGKWLTGTYKISGTVLADDTD